MRKLFIIFLLLIAATCQAAIKYQYFYKSDRTNYMRVRASESLAEDWTWIWPPHDTTPTTGQQLTITVVGNELTTTWEDPGGIGGVGDIDAVGDITTGSAFTGDDAGRFMWGRYSEFQIYGRALSTEEIGSLVNKQNINGSLLLYWKLAENIGSRVYDSAISGDAGIQRLLGDRRGAFTTVASGGFDYSTL